MVFSQYAYSAGSNFSPCYSSADLCVSWYFTPLWLFLWAPLDSSFLFISVGWALGSNFYFMLSLFSGLHLSSPIPGLFYRLLMIFSFLDGQHGGTFPRFLSCFDWCGSCSSWEKSTFDITQPFFLHRIFSMSICFEQSHQFHYISFSFLTLCLCSAFSGLLFFYWASTCLWLSISQFIWDSFRPWVNSKINFIAKTAIIWKIRFNLLLVILPAAFTTFDSLEFVSFSEDLRFFPGNLLFFTL